MVADRWFETRGLDDGVTLIIEPHVHPVWQANIFHVRGRDRDLLVDAGLGVGLLRPAVEALSDHVVIAFATHRHVDHVGGLWEFDDRIAHEADAGDIAVPERSMSLRSRDHPWMGSVEDEYLISALPHAGYDPGGYRQVPVAIGRTVGEGDVIDLGDRVFEVMHLPGHTPGSLGLLEESTGTLFTGDAIYDGEIFDFLPESNVPEYITTMERLRTMAVEVVHGGHGPTLSGERMRQVAEAYLSRRR